jgi:hypothetical protein
MDPDFGTSGLRHVPKSLIGSFDQRILQPFDSERFLVDHVIPPDREALSFDAI